MSRSVPAVAQPRRPSPVQAPSLFRLAAVPVMALAALALFELANWDKITPGVTALNASVGGLARAEAVTRVAPEVQLLLDRPLVIQGADQSWATTPRELGLRLDPNELVDAAYSIGRQGSPFDRLGDQLDVLVHGRTISAASTTDRTALDGSLAGMASQIERAPTDARLTLNKDGTVTLNQAQNGLAVDIGASRDQLTLALNAGAPSVALVTTPIPPSIPDEQLQAARDQLDQLLGPDAPALTVTFGDKSWRLEHGDVVKLVSLSGGTRPGEPATVKIDNAALEAWTARLARDIDQSVQDARFAFSGGSLKVLRPSRQGRSLDQRAAVQAVRDALLAGDSSLELPVTVVNPSVSSDDPESLGITELIDRGSTSFAGSVPEKKHNIQLAAQRLTGVVVAPGATFSFNDAVGPTTIDAGFQWGFGITSGNDGPRTVPSVAGGICQVATTLFQPVFWAGYQLEERYWHLYWIPAYTSRGVVGLDVTVDSDSGLDFKWTNTTSSYVLIQASTDDSNVYFALYGKKPPWKVQVDDAVITNRVSPDTRPLAQEEPTLPWGRTVLVETARDGFDAEVIRRVIPSDGSKPRELDLKSTYQPARTITLVGSKGKPAGASVDDAIQKVLDAQKPKPTPAPAAPSPTAVAASTVAPAPTAAPAPAAPAAQPTPAPKPAATVAPANQPAPTPKPQPQAGASKASGIAPTPTPGH
jgi:vancomycin resistance protein YoaR